MPGGITGTEQDCVTGKVPVALIVPLLEKVICDEAFVDKFTDEAVAVVSTEAAVNVWLCDVPNLEICVTTTIWSEADDVIVGELLLRVVNSLD